MKLSVITVTYNSEALLARCLDSVRNQSYPDIEHIIVDGGSKDRTMEIVRNAERGVRNTECGGSTTNNQQPATSNQQLSTHIHQRTG